MWWKAVFSASLLQSPVSHDPSEIILICCFAAQETSMLKTFVLLNNSEYLEPNTFFWIIWWIEHLKEKHLQKIDFFFCNKSLQSLLIMLIYNSIF